MAHLLQIGHTGLDAGPRTKVKQTVDGGISFIDARHKNKDSIALQATACSSTVYLLGKLRDSISRGTCETFSCLR